MTRALPYAIALAARALPFFFGFEHYGDAPVRIEVAERWALAPHLWRGFAEAYQYGPLHLSLIGWALRILPDRFVAPRLLSLVCGLACIWLLWRITERIAGEAAALVATCALALSPLHIQVSTTGASEAVFLALFLGCLETLLAGGVVVPALLLGAAGLVRYDGWLYVPLISALFWRERGTLRTALFAAVAAAPALFWLWVNWKFTGDALAPIHHINRDHQQLAEMGVRFFGQARYRLYCLVYWPIAISGIATPVVGVAAIAGAWRTLSKRADAWRALWTGSASRTAPAPSADPGRGGSGLRSCMRSDAWRIAALAWIPAAYFTFRAAVLADFRPLSRFALVAATLSLPFAWGAFESPRDAPQDSPRRWPRPRVARAALVLGAVVLVATPVTLAALSWNRDGALAEWARPLSPISSLPPGVAQAARWLRANVRDDDTILLDGVWDYLDVPLAFAVNLPDERWARLSWTDDFEQRLLRHKPTVAVLFYQGNLRHDPRAAHATEDSDRFTFNGDAFCLQARFTYASTYRRCGLR